MHLLFSPGQSNLNPNPYTLRNLLIGWSCHYQFSNNFAHLNSIVCCLTHALLLLLYLVNLRPFLPLKPYLLLPSRHVWIHLDAIEAKNKHSFVCFYVRVAVYDVYQSFLRCPHQLELGLVFFTTILSGFYLPICFATRDISTFVHMRF